MTDCTPDQLKAEHAPMIQMLKRRLCAEGPHQDHTLKLTLHINTCWKSCWVPLCAACYKNPPIPAMSPRASLSYHSLTSDSCLVLYPSVCSPLRHSLIKPSALSSRSSSLPPRLFRVFFLPVLPRFASSAFLFSPNTEFSHVLTRLSDTSDCVGVRSDQNLPAETLRGQRHPMAYPVPLDLMSGRTSWAVRGWECGWKERKALTFQSEHH